MLRVHELCEAFIDPVQEYPCSISSNGAEMSAKHAGHRHENKTVRVAHAEGIYSNVPNCQRLGVPAVSRSISIGVGGTSPH